jgi:hypothetical protein
MQKIADWLKKLGMSEYVQRFAENDIDISVLRHLTDQDLKELGLSLGHRRKMLAAIAELGGTPPAAPQSPVEREPYTQDAAERRQLTVMFCDLVGSTALSATVTMLEQIAWPPYDCLIYGTRYHTVAHRTGSGWGGAYYAGRLQVTGHLLSCNGGPFMKRLLLASVAAIGLFAPGTNLRAADMAVKAPPPPYVPPQYNWTGFYIGGNLGAGAVTGTVFDTIGVSQGDIGGRATFIGGGQIGYNWQFSPNLVFAIDWFFDGISSDNGGGITFISPVTGDLITGSGKADWVTTVTGVRREKAALSSGCKAHPANRSSRKQPEQSWRQRNGLYELP